jgi:hypothetical protein
MRLEGGMFTEFSWESLLEAPTPVAARSKLWIYSSSLAGIAGSNPTGGRGVCLVCIVFCQVEVSAKSLSVVQRSPTERGVSEGESEASIMIGPDPLGAVTPQEKVS